MIAGTHIIGIDPGPVESALVFWSGDAVVRTFFGPNHDVFEALNKVEDHRELWQLWIESVSHYGMPVGQEVFDTCIWIGRFAQHWQDCLWSPAHLVSRSNIKLHLCHSARAKDPNIRQALIDRWGKPGTKKHPGALYGISNHLWSALAVVAFAIDNQVDLEQFSI